MENNTIDNKKHEQTRKKLKVIGITFLTIGGIFFLVGIISFFIALTLEEYQIYFGAAL